VDIGNYGDSSAFASSDFGKELEGGKMHLPPPCVLDGFPDFEMPYFFVGDEAFALKSWMQRPYPGKYLTEEKRIYNYRLSRARRTIENAFGIMVARWRILTHSIPTSVDTADKIVQETVCLHNFLRQSIVLRDLWTVRILLVMSDLESGEVSYQGIVSLFPFLHAEDQDNQSMQPKLEKN
jgi:hypothetical protein